MIQRLVRFTLRRVGNRVKHSFYAFNVARQSFINLGVAIADTPFARLRGLLGKVRIRSDEALWVVPSRGIHTIGLMFPIDVVYLDAKLRVIAILESLGPLRIAPIRWQCASVLELPARSIYGSGTQVGDQLIICSPEEMELYWTSQRQAEEQKQGQQKQPERQIQLPPPARKTG